MAAPLTLPAVPATTPVWLARLVAFLLAVCGPVLDCWNPSGKLNSSAAQAAVVVVFVAVAGGIWLAHEAITAIHAYGFSKTAAGVFLAESGDELRALISEAKPLVEQAKPALDAVGALSGLAGRVGEVEHRLGQVNGIDRAQLLDAVRQLLGPLVSVPATPAAEPSVPVAPADTAVEVPAAPTPVQAPAPGAPVVTAAVSTSAPA